MKKLLISFGLLGSIIFPATTLAQTTQPAGFDIRHAYNPMIIQHQPMWPNQNTSAVKTRVENLSNNFKQNRLVCVEAWHTMHNLKTHIGCLTVDLGAMNSQNPGWAREFDAPLWNLPNGSYKLQYSYQETDGNWHGVKNMEGRQFMPLFTK